MQRKDNISSLFLQCLEQTSQVKVMEHKRKQRRDQHSPAMAIIASSNHHVPPSLAMTSSFHEQPTASHPFRESFNRGLNYVTNMTQS